jgi:hypothetical protein
MENKNQDFKSKKYYKWEQIPAVYTIHVKATRELLWIGETDDLHGDLSEHYHYSHSETLRGCIKNDDSMDIPIDSLRAETVYKREIESSEAKRREIKKTLDEERNPRYDVNNHEGSDEEHTSTTDAEIPQVPQIDPDSIEPGYKKKRYIRLSNDDRFSPDNAPATARQIIHEHQKLSKPDYVDLMVQRGYERDGGEIRASLPLLDDTTDEIKIKQNTEDGTTYIVWTGN